MLAGAVAWLTITASMLGVDGGSLPQQARWRPLVKAPGVLDVVGPRADGPSEATGRIFAFDPGGRVRLVAESGLPAGGDIGVESVGFVPSKLGSGGAGYLADMGAPGSPTQGTDSVLVLRGRDLARARLRPGQLVAATESGAKTIAIRCARRCTVRRFAIGPAATHGEGHVTFVRD